VKIIRRGLEIRYVNSAGVDVRRYTLDLLRHVTEMPRTGSSLRIVAFSDWRVQDIGKLIRFVKAQKKRPDLILYAGDDIKRFRPPRRNLFQQIARLSVNGLCAVAGNDDPPACRDLIAGKHVYAVHSCALVLGRFAVVGAEGAPLFQNDTEHRNIGRLLYPERVTALQTKRWRTSVLAKKKLIIVSHAPPFGVLDSAVRYGPYGPRSIGSQPLREFLETDTNSLLCVCGHVHRCGGQPPRFAGAW
jgi:Icc-related predicted phosphoesterase